MKLTKLFFLLSSAVSAATLYVSNLGDNASPACTSLLPCATIARAATLALPGDIVEVAPGIYNERPYITKSGLPDNPITYRGHSGVCPTTPTNFGFLRDKRPDPSVTMLGFFIRANYIRIECFRLPGLPTDFVTLAGDLRAGVYIHTGHHHVEVLDNHISGRYSAAVQGGPLANTLVYNITVARNYVTRTPYGFLVYCANACLIEENESDGLYAVAKVDPITGRVTSADMDHVRIFGNGHTYRNNFFHGNDMANCTGCHTDCFQTWNQGRKNEMATNVVITNNVCWNAHQGIILRDEVKLAFTHREWLVTNNVFAFGPNGSSMAWCALFEHAENVVFEDNLCFAAGQAGYFNGTTGVHRFNIHHGAPTPYNSRAMSNRTAGVIDGRGNILIVPPDMQLTQEYPLDHKGIDPRMIKAWHLFNRLPKAGF